MHFSDASLLLEVFESARNKGVLISKISKECQKLEVQISNPINYEEN